jgi:cation transport ATPase
MKNSLDDLHELLALSHDLNKNLKRGLLFNIVPGALTIIYALTPHATILGSLILSEVGLLAGVLNSMSPLREKKKLLALPNSSNKKS